MRTFLFILLFLVGLALLCIIMLQDSKGDGLSALSGHSDTFWQMNKGRSAEGILKKITAALVVAFFALCVLLNMPITAEKKQDVSDEATVMTEAESENIVQVSTEVEVVFDTAETESEVPHIGSIMA